MLPFPTPEDQFDHYRFNHFESINTLNNDVLLVIFNHYRLDNEINWNIRLGWCNLSQVCRRWRYLVYGSAFYLGLQILCTNGTPLVDTLVHLPPLPLLVDYQYPTATLIDAQDELGIFQALQLRDRMLRVDLLIPPSILHRLLMLMDEPFPVLSHLSLSSSSGEGATLLLSKTLLAPNLRHLSLLGIGLPTKLVFLSSTVSLVTLILANIRDFSYFLPQHLIVRLRSLPQLEELSIDFSVPLPRPSTEGELLQDIEAPVTLPLLKRLTFRGVNVYFDSFVAQIRVPLLEQLSITLFNQIYFALPHLSHFIDTTEGLRLPIAKIIFKPDAVSIVTHQGERQPGIGPSSFSLHLMCRQFDWQIDSAAQICNALVTSLSGIEQLSLEFEGQRVSAEWEDNAVDAATWCELLEPFTRARKLRIGRALSWEISCALEWAEMGSDPGLLPNLEELAAELEEEHADNAFMSFIEARQAAGRPILLSIPHKQSVPRQQSVPRPQPVPHEQFVPRQQSVSHEQSVPRRQSVPLLARRFPWAKGNAQRKYIDLINEATFKWANCDPPKRIRAGDFGTIDKKTGELMVEGNIFTHQEIARIAHKFPPFEGPETDLYLIHSQQVRSLDVQADVDVGTAADDGPLALKRRWQFNTKRGAILLMYRPRLICVPDPFFYEKFDLPPLKRKVVVNQVYECPGFFTYLSNKASEQVTVSLRSGTSASRASTLVLADIGWLVEGAAGISQQAYRPGAVYTPLFNLKSQGKRLWSK